MNEQLTADFTAALVDALAGAIGTVADGPVKTSRGAVDTGAGWVMTFEASGARQQGSFSAWIDGAGAALMARVAGGDAGEPDDAAIGERLRTLWTQAAGFVCLAPAFVGLKVEASGPVQGPAEATDRAGFLMDLAGKGTAQLTIAGEFADEARATTRTTNMDVVLDMELPLIVRFGRTAMSLKALSALGPGSIVSMGRSPDDPVELLVSGHVIARGEVVIVDGNYGVRITDLVSPAERAKGLVEV